VKKLQELVRERKEEMGRLLRADKDKGIVFSDDDETNTEREWCREELERRFLSGEETFEELANEKWPLSRNFFIM